MVTFICNVLSIGYAFRSRRGLRSRRLILVLTRAAARTLPGMGREHSCQGCGYIETSRARLRSVTVAGRTLGWVCFYCVDHITRKIEHMLKPENKDV